MFGMGKGVFDSCMNFFIDRWENISYGFFKNKKLISNNEIAISMGYIVRS